MWTPQVFGSEFVSELEDVYTVRQLGITKYTKTLTELELTENFLKNVY